MHSLHDAKQFLGRGEVAAAQGAVEHILDRILKPAPQRIPLHGRTSTRLLGRLVCGGQDFGRSANGKRELPHRRRLRQRLATQLLMSVALSTRRIVQAWPSSEVACRSLSFTSHSNADRYSGSSAEQPPTVIHQGFTLVGTI
jgi:hypothetical protein